MPTILAIDTSTEACSVALLTSPTDIHQSLVIAPREHTRRLLPMVESLLSEHNVQLSQLDGIAFGVGPGSFTGLRIALSTAQGLAYGADLPLIPISTLKTMAQTAIRLELADPAQTIVPVIDARMNEVYWSAYCYDSSTQQVRETSEEVIAAPDVFAKNTLLTADNICAVGSGWQYEELQTEELQTVISGSAKLDHYPEAYDIAVLAQTALANDQTISPLTAVPTYMRNEISWKKRQRIRPTS